MPDQRHPFFNRLHKRFGLGNLRSDVHLDTPNLDVTHLLRTSVDLRHTIDSDSEFILGLTGADVFVGIRRDVRVDPYGNRSPFTQRFGNLIDCAQFLFGFDIKTEYFAAQSVLDLFTAFANTRKGTLCRIASGLDHSIKFAPGNNIKPGTSIGEETNDGEV